MRLRRFRTIGLVLLMVTACSHKQKVAEQPLAPETPKAVKAETPQQVTTAKPNKDIQKGQIVKCMIGKEERLIRLDKESKRCEVHYIKSGEESQAAWAEATPSICAEVFDKIRNNIEEKGFKCDVEGEKTS